MVTRPRTQHSDAVQAHVLFREVNERIKSLLEPSDVLALGGEWVCECANTGCLEHLDMSLADYEAVRAFPHRFAALPGHELPRGARVLERTRRYVIFERAEERAGRARAS